MTTPTTTATISAVPPRIARFPDPKKLPPRTRAIAAEYSRVYDQLEQLVVTFREATSTEAHTAAVEADAQAHASAIRAGKTASSVGRPATVALEKKADALEAELVGTIIVVGQLGEELQAAMAEAWFDPKVNGLAEARAAIDAYKDSVAAIAPKRQAAVDAMALPVFLRELGTHYSPERADGPTMVMRVPNINLGALGVNMHARDALLPAQLEGLLILAADRITAALPEPPPT
jgi:hypothetical protein